VETADWVEKVVETVATVAKVVVVVKAAEEEEGADWADWAAGWVDWAEVDSESRCCTPSSRTRLRSGFQRCSLLTRTYTHRCSHTSSCCMRSIAGSR